MTSIRFETAKTGPASESKPMKKEIWSSIKFLGMLIALFLILRFGFSIAMVSGQSMAPTFDDGSLVITNNVFYQPERGDIVIYTDSNGFDVIKRVIGLPGDEVAIVHGVVHINGVSIQEDYTIGVSTDLPSQMVAEDSYFLIGDHRTPGESYDSRSPEVGSIGREAIRGEVLLALYPFMVGSGK